MSDDQFDEVRQMIQAIAFGQTAILRGLPKEQAELAGEFLLTCSGETPDDEPYRLAVLLTYLTALGFDKSDLA